MTNDVHDPVLREFALKHLKGAINYKQFQILGLSNLQPLIEEVDRELEKIHANKR